eukprot:201506_1
MNAKAAYNAAETDVERKIALAKQQRKLESKPQDYQKVESLPERKDGQKVLDIKLSQIVQAIDDAVSQNKTALLLDGTFNGEQVDTFLSYQPSNFIPVKGLYASLNIVKDKTKEEIWDSLRTKMMMSLKFGTFLVISMTDCAVRLKSEWNNPDRFPIPEIFEPETITNRDFYMKFVTEEDMKSNMSNVLVFEPKTTPGLRVVVTSKFSPKDYKSFLNSPLPLDHFLVYHVLPDDEYADGIARLALEEQKNKTAWDDAVDREEKFKDKLKELRAARENFSDPKDRNKQFCVLLKADLENHPEANPKGRKGDVWPVSEMKRILAFVDKSPSAWGKFDKPSQSDARQKMWDLADKLFEYFGVDEGAESRLFFIAQQSEEN